MHTSAKETGTPARDTLHNGYCKEVQVARHATACTAQTEVDTYPYLATVQQEKPSCADKNHISQRDYGSRQGNGDAQEHQEQRGRADTLDPRQRSVRLRVVMPQSSRHRGVQGEETRSVAASERERERAKMGADRCVHSAESSWELPRDDVRAAFALRPWCPWSTTKRVARIVSMWSKSACSINTSVQPHTGGTS